MSSTAPASPSTAPVPPSAEESLLEAVLRRRAEAAASVDPEADGSVNVVDLVPRLAPQLTEDGLPRRQRDTSVVDQFAPLQPDPAELPWIKTRRPRRRRWAGPR